MAGITTFLDASQLPARTQDQQTFDNAMAYVMQNFPKWGGEINATLAALNAIAAGGAYAIPYKFSTTTTDADPGAGFLRLDNATQNAATTIRLDLTGLDLADYTGLIDAFDAATSTIKGQIRICKQADPSKFLGFNVTARATPTGYRNISVTPIASTSANPFANNDPVILFFQRTGDKGDIGTTAFPTLRVQDQKPVGTSGGSSSGGIQTRVLNTTTRNTIPGASVASNQVSLPAGTYKVTGSAPAYVSNAHQAFLYNVTAGLTLLFGTQEMSASADATQTRSFILGEITLSAQTILELRHWVSAGTATYGLGYGNVGMTASALVYAEILFEKVG